MTKKSFESIKANLKTFICLGHINNKPEISDLFTIFLSYFWLCIICYLLDENQTHVQFRFYQTYWSWWSTTTITATEVILELTLSLSRVNIFHVLYPKLFRILVISAYLWMYRKKSHEFPFAIENDTFD